MPYVAQPDLSSLRFGENRDRNKVRSIVTLLLEVTEFKITHSGGADAYEGWSVDSIFAGRATLEASIDYRKGFASGDGQHGTRPPSAFAHADDPDPDGSTWTQFADLMNFHLVVFPPAQFRTSMIFQFIAKLLFSTAC
jgi:hypothetical protein